jgi:glucan biosynthesis protein C
VDIDVDLDRAHALGVAVAAATHRAFEQPTAPFAPGRCADVEWLRVVGMLLVFTIHAAEPFNPWDTWHIVSPARPKVLGEVVFFLAPWIMPLFMLLAGQSAWHALERRTPGTYVRERLLRIGLPLVAGLLVVVPPQVWLERRLRGEFQGSLVAFYPHFFEGVYPRGNFSWHHLWFLVFLLVFAIVTLPLFLWLRGSAGRRAMARIALPCAGPGGLACLLLPAIAVRLGLEVAFAGFPAVSYDWSSRGLLLPAFVAGFVLEGDPGFRRALARHWRAALGAGMAASAGLLGWAWPGSLLERLPSPVSAGGFLLWTVYAVAAASWPLALVGAARASLARRTPLLARASEIVYPFYVLHHTIVVAVAYAVVRHGDGAARGFAVVFVVSLAVTGALCGVVSSIDPLRILFGLKRRAPPAGTGTLEREGVPT